MNSNVIQFPGQKTIPPEHISPEFFRALVAAQQPFFEGGLRVLSDYLPQSDRDLHGWLVQAVTLRDRLNFGYMISAAALAGRKLEASLLPQGAMLVPDPYLLGWIAYHMEGEVVEGMMAGIKNSQMPQLTQALALFHVAAWWVKFRTGPLPADLISAARSLARIRPLEAEAYAILAALVALAPDEALRHLLPRGQDHYVRQQGAKIKDALLKGIEEEFALLLPEKPDRDYTLGQPRRRAVDKIHRNVLCHCGSEKRYKECCIEADLERLRHSTNVAGKTELELYYDPGAELTKTRMEKMPADELARLQPARIEPEMMETYFTRLAENKLFRELIGAFRKLGVRAEWEAVWTGLFSVIVREWRRDIALQLLKTHKRPKEMLAKLGPGVRLLLVSNNRKKFFAAAEAEALAALQSGEEEPLQQLAHALLASHCPALGILAARSLLPVLREREDAAAVFKHILQTRDRLNLSPDDEAAGFMAERERRERKRPGETRRETQAKLEAKCAEVRAANESIAKLQREADLLIKREKREARTPEPVSHDEEIARGLRDKITSLQGMVTEDNKIIATLEQELEQERREKEKLAASKGEPDKAEAADDDEGEAMEVSKHQKPRLIDFPKKFGETLSALPAHVARAGMNTLGRLASGECTAFDGIKQLKAYPGALRKKVTGDYRLIFSLFPDRVQVIDLVLRRDLDRCLKHLRAAKQAAAGSW